jgi:hypothetical protein
MKRKPVKPTASAGFMERATGIEPTSEPWEVLNFPIPFSSQRHGGYLECKSIVELECACRSPESNCRLSAVSVHMVDDAAETVCVATPAIYLRRPRIRSIVVLVAITGFFMGVTKADEPEPY